MADNVLDALADLIENSGVVNERVWPDDAPDNATKPYVTVFDAIGLTPALRGDGRTIMLNRLLQASLWERLDRENPDVARQLFAAVDGAVVTLDDGSRIRLHVESAPRLPETSDNIAHRALTISARHDPTAV